MANTEVHDQTCLLVGTGVLAGALWLGDVPIFLISLGCYSGLLISPDWDWQVEVSTDDGELVVVGKVLRRWAWAGWYYQWLRAYPRLFEHRGLISHSFLVSTIIRLVWLLWPLVLGIYYPISMFWWFVGLVLVDFLHIWADGVLRRNY